MAQNYSVDEKSAGGEIHEHDDHIDKPAVASTRILLGDEAYQSALLKEPPRPWSQVSLLLYAISAVGFCCSTSNGFDSSVFGLLLQGEDFKATMSVGSVGIEAGIVSSMHQIGSVAAIPFIGPAIDTFGRRVGMLIGGLSIWLGVIIEGTCSYTGSSQQFMAGRFLLGFGVAIIASAGPCYTVEISHPAYRGIVVALYNCFWPVGAIVASIAVRFSKDLPGHASWTVPVWLQGLFPGIVVVLCLFLPESPRWLYVNGKREEAKAMIAKYHGEGNTESEWVKLQLWEYETHLEMDGADKRWWDYRALFKNRPSMYRLMCNCVVSLFGQWAGNSVVSYFLIGFLESAGITDKTLQLNLAVGMNAIQIAFAVLGCTFIERFGRRGLLIGVNIACAITWVGVTASASQGINGNLPAQQATIAMVYLFQICYSFGWTPLQALYPVEVLSFEMRAKGMAFSNLFVSAGGLVGQFGFPVALENIGWKLYIVFIFWCFIQAGVSWYFIPETKNRTLEELDDIFNAPNPRKFSTEKRKVDLSADGEILKIEVVNGSTGVDRA